MESAVNTVESFREVIGWLRGGDMTPDPRMEDRFIEVLAAMVSRRMTDDAARERERTAMERAKRREAVAGRALSLSSILAEDINPEPEPEPSSGLDSYVLAKALSYMGVLEGHPLNMSQIQIMLYISYGLWLAGKGERLTEEHPQMWQFGPVFPRAYSRFRKVQGDGKQEYELLKDMNPDVFGLLSRRFRRHAWTKASDLTAPHVAEGSPWAETRKGSPDRWGAQIADEDIKAWFAARIA